MGTVGQHGGGSGWPMAPPMGPYGAPWGPTDMPGSQIPPAPVAGWFKMLNCSYTLPSFPRGGVYPSPYPALENPPVTKSTCYYLVDFWGLKGMSWRMSVSLGANLSLFWVLLQSFSWRLRGTFGVVLGTLARLGCIVGHLRSYWGYFGASCGGMSG